MLISLEGHNSTGKTTFAYTAPLKIVGFQFDMGLERALYGAKYEELFKDLEVNIVRYDPSSEGPVDVEAADITVYELPAPIQLGSAMVQGVKELWGYFIIRVSHALMNPEVRTVVIDTMTNARRIKADAYLQELQAHPRPGEPPRTQLLQIEYGKVNDPIRDLYTTAQGLRKNLIATHHLTDERKDGVSSDGRIVQGMLTGNKILEGLGNTYNFVDVAIRMEKDRAQISGLFQKCGYQLLLEGTKIENPTWDSLADHIESFTGGKLVIERKGQVETAA